MRWFLATMLVVLGSFSFKVDAINQSLPVGTPANGIDGSDVSDNGVFSTDDVLLDAIAGSGDIDSDGLDVLSTIAGEDGDSVLVVLGNGSREPVNSVQVIATLRDSSGGGQALGATTRLMPAQIQPGGVGFAVVRLDGSDGDISADLLPEIELREVSFDPGSINQPIEVIDAQLTTEAINTVLLGPSGGVATVFSVAICSDKEDADGITWSAYDERFSLPLREGDAQNFSLNAPSNCEDDFLVAISAGF